MNACDDCGTTDGPLEGNTTAEADGTIWDGFLCRPCSASATAAEPEQPVRVPVRMCVRCYTITDAPVVVSEVHANSGPGFNVYACSACAPHFPPLPDVLALLETGWRNRAGGGR